MALTSAGIQAIFILLAAFTLLILNIVQLVRDRGLKNAATEMRTVVHSGLILITFLIMLYCIVPLANSDPKTLSVGLRLFHDFLLCSVSILCAGSLFYLNYVFMNIYLLTSIEPPTADKMLDLTVFSWLFPMCLIVAPFVLGFALRSVSGLNYYIVIFYIPLAISVLVISIYLLHTNVRLNKAIQASEDLGDAKAIAVAQRTGAMSYSKSENAFASREALKSAGASGPVKKSSKGNIVSFVYLVIALFLLVVAFVIGLLYESSSLIKNHLSKLDVNKHANYTDYYDLPFAVPGFHEFAQILVAIIFTFHFWKKRANPYDEDHMSMLEDD